MTVRGASVPGRRLVLERAFKLGLAAGIATWVARLAHLRLPWFAALAAIVTTEITIRSSIRSGRDGVLGAAVGATTGLGVALVAKGQVWAVVLVVFADLALLGLIGLTTAGRQAAIVASVIVLLPVETISTPEFAWMRFVETVIGVGSALAVNLVVFPPRARRGVRLRLGDAFAALATMYRLVVAAEAGDEPDRDGIVAARRDYREAMRAVDDLWDEASSEAPLTGGTGPHWRVTARSVWEQCVAMDDAIVDRRARAQLEEARAELAALATSSATALDEVAAALRDGAELPGLDALEPARVALVARVGAIEPRMVPFDAALAALTFVNGMSLIALRLTDLRGA